MNRNYKLQIKAKLDKHFPYFMLKMRNYLKRGFEPEMNLLSYFCNRNSVSVDIGANYGIYSYKLTLLSKYVYSFEPVPYLYRNLLKAFRKTENIKIYNIGLSEVEGSGVLYSPIYTHGWSTLEKDNEFFRNLSEGDKLQKFDIELNKLDNYDLENVSFIKIDVEGHEYKVVEGAVNTIRKNMPVLQVEIEEKHKKDSVRNVVNLIKGIDSYLSFFMMNGKLIKFDDFDRANYPSSANNTYIYNFLFIHKDSAVMKYLEKDRILK